MNTTLLVIPARYASSRFPGKPLVAILGVSLIERVHRLSCRVGRGVKVVVATDDVRIKSHVLKFGGEAMMTRADHPSGTDRVAEVSRKHPGEVVINIQGDEPLLEPKVIQQLIRVMHRNPKIQMATLCHVLSDETDYLDPNVVKVVMDQTGNALYFSRAPIPHVRNRNKSRRCEGMFRHIGIYAYRRDFLMEYVRWPQSKLEKMESLEQLRALENGVRIRVVKTDYPAIGVDVPGDVKKVEKMLRNRNS